MFSAYNRMLGKKFTQAEAVELLINFGKKHNYIVLNIGNYIHKNSKEKIKCKCLNCGKLFDKKFQDRDRGHCYVRKITAHDIAQKITHLANGRYKFYVDNFMLQASTNVYDCVIYCECLKCGYKFANSYRKLYYNKQGCRKCNGNIIPNKKEIITKLQKIANGRYTFKFLEQYHGVRTKIECECMHCHHRWQSDFHTLKRGTACINRCLVEQKRNSKPELEILGFINKQYPKLEIRVNDRSLISPFELDIVLPSLKLAFEFNGIYWHSDENIKKRLKGKFASAEHYHSFKTKKCFDIGFDLIHISEKDYIDDKNKIFECINNAIIEKIGVENCFLRVLEI